MKLHSKLMTLLVLFGLLPALAVGWVGREAIRELGGDFAAQARRLVFNSVSSDLRETIRQAAASVDQQRAIVELSLRLQAEAVADLLSGQDGVPDVSPIKDTFEALDRTAGNAGLRRYVASPTGAMLTWPPKEGIREEFDPREKPWFATASEAEGPVWASPTIDPDTGQLVLKAVAPVRDAQGDVIAVTGIDVAVTSGLARLRDQGNLPVGTTALLTLTQPMPDAPPNALPVIARAAWEDAGSEGQVGGSWRTGTGAVLHLGRPEFQELVEALRADKSGIVWMPWEGERALWAFGALGGMDAGLIYIVPQDAIAGAAAAVAEAVEDATGSQMAATGGVVLAILGLAVAGSWIGARSVTKPLRKLRDTMDEVAAGNLGARASVTTGDEVGEAATHFNRVVPLLADRMAMKRSLEVAQGVQQALLPQAPPELDGFDIAGLSRYSDETGGDYFDYVPLRMGPGGRTRRLAVLVGDVAGHGVSAALLMTTVRAQLRAKALGVDEPSSLLAAVNPLLAADARGGRFMTLFCVFLTAGQRLVTWSSAGHDPALLIGKHSCDELAGEDIPLGIEAQWDYAPSMSRILTSDDIMVIGTDGLWETRNPAGDMLDREHVVEIVRRNPDANADTLCRYIAKAVERFRGKAPQKDDVTIVVIRTL